MFKLITQSLRNKLIVVTVGLVIVLLAAVLLVVGQQVRMQTMNKVQQDFALTYQTFERFMWLRNERLVESCILISELPVLKGNLSTKDHPTIREYILTQPESPAKIVDVDIFTLTDEKGVVLFRLDDPSRHGDTIASLPFVASALAGIDPAASQVTTWVVDNHLYQVACASIWQRNYIIGTLTLGKKITQSEAVSLKQDTHSEITFVLGNRIVASTHSEIGKLDLLRAYLVDLDEMKRQLAAGGRVPRELQIEGERYQCVFASISDDIGAVYVMGISMDKALAWLDVIERVILFVGLFALATALLSGYLIARGVTAPIQQLVAGTEKILQGNYDFELPVSSKDEIGRLASSFNNMVVGLKERFLMSKFISSSTMKMIRKEGGNIALGGERRNMTVLFSDIRGFTEYSEKVPPEVVIDMLNRYLSVQAKTVIKHNGIIDKYVGDELIAIFEGGEMVDDAVRCAVEIQKEIEKLNDQHDESIHVGIGIHTGMAIVGNVGSDERMDHTVLGSNMNLGARLCSIAKPCQIIISETSWRLLIDKDVHVRQLEEISVKGFSRPLLTYEVLYAEPVEKTRA